MAANIAHEIKNPLTGALGALEIIMEDMPEGNSCIAIMQEIIVQLERINQAVNDLLSYAKPADPVFEKINLNEIIKRTLSLLESQIKAENIEVNLSLMKNIPILTADEKLIQQLFWNILLNAVQSMKNNGTLTIKTEKENSTVKIEIQDTGKGIPKDNYEKIFKPFFTNKHKGTGLGLAISKRIVDQHSGDISIESEVGKGTTFIITLPISRLTNKIYES
jgi:signal transduction histidine kinase